MPTYTINGITPKLETTDVEGTIQFYTEKLGFKLTGRFKGHIFLSKDEQTIMFHEMMNHHDQEKPIMTGSLYISTNEVDELYDTIKDQVKISYPLENFDFGMREFGMWDNNGYLLIFGKAVSST